MIADGVHQSLVVYEQQEQVHAGFDGCGTVLSVVALSSDAYLETRCLLFARIASWHRFGKM